MLHTVYIFTLFTQVFSKNLKTFQNSPALCWFTELKTWHSLKCSRLQSALQGVRYVWFKKAHIIKSTKNRAPFRRSSHSSFLTSFSLVNGFLILSKDAPWFNAFKWEENGISGASPHCIGGGGGLHNNKGYLHLTVECEVNCTKVGLAWQLAGGFFDWIFEQ